MTTLRPTRPRPTLTCLSGYPHTQPYGWKTTTCAFKDCKKQGMRTSEGILVVRAEEGESL